MKKTLGVVAAAALSALPMASALAVTSATLTDTLALTIEDNCAFTRDDTADHTGDKSVAEGGTGGVWTEDAFIATVINGKTYDAIAKSKFTVICNNVGGYEVTVEASDFTTDDINDADDFVYSQGDYAASGSSWYIGGLQTASSNLVKQETAATDGTTFEVTYNVEVSSTQQAATYDAEAVYTFATL